MLIVLHVHMSARPLRRHSSGSAAKPQFIHLRVLDGQGRIFSPVPCYSQPPSSLASVMSMMDYQWRPLDNTRKEIRVLNLEPGAGDPSLSGQLRHVFLDESGKTDYETISYAWGDTALVDSILVDGTRIPIPASAGSALRCMRSPVGIRSSLD